MEVQLYVNADTVSFTGSVTLGVVADKCCQCLTQAFIAIREAPASEPDPFVAVLLLLLLMSMKVEVWLFVLSTLALSSVGD